MDAQSLNTLSQIIKLQIGRHSSSGQTQGQTPKPMPGASGGVMYPHTSGMSMDNAGRQTPQPPTATHHRPTANPPYMSMEGHYQNQHEGTVSGYNPQSHQHGMRPSQQQAHSQQPHTTLSLSQPQFNPAYMIAAGMAGGSAHNGQGVPNTAFHNMGENGHQTTSNAESGFDPNRLMTAIEAEMSHYNPNAFLTKQNFITPNQWNYQHQRPQNPQEMNPGQHEETKPKQQESRPESMGNAQMNFEPDAMISSLGSNNHQFSFDPDKINSFGTGFHPGSNPQSSAMSENSKDMFNADTINKELMSYSGQPMQQLQQEEQAKQGRQHTAYNPNTFNHASVNEVPTTFMQFLPSGHNGNAQLTDQSHDEGGSPSEEHKPSESNSPPQHSMMSSNFRPGSLYASNPHQSHGISTVTNMDDASSFDSTFQGVAFNPDKINAAQLQFNPNSLIKSLFDGGSQSMSGAQVLSKTVRKSNHPAANGTDATTRNISRPETSKAGNNQSPIVSSETPAPSTIPPPTSDNPRPTAIPTTSVKLARPASAMFNPNAVNAGMEQVMNFKPGSFMVGFNQLPAGQTNSLGNSAFNPDKVNQMSPMMSALMGKNMVTSNTASESGTHSGSSQSFSMSALFNPSEVNKAQVSFDINQQMGFSGNSGNAMFDPMMVNVMSVQNHHHSTENEMSFLGSGGMNMMDTSAFIGSFDPNQVNQASKMDMHGTMDQNGSSNHSGMDYMSAFLGMGSLGGAGDSNFGGSFNPADVNNAIFNPDAVNHAQMNFDPSDMLDRNPGYDTEKATQTDFDPTKINEVHMHFQPPFLPVENAKDINSTSSSANTFNQYNFIPGQLSPNGNAMAFDPSKINHVNMHFSPMDMSNPNKEGNNNATSQTHMLFSPPLSNTGSNMNIPMPVFDPVAVNNMQMNFQPSSALNGSPILVATGDNGSQISSPPPVHTTEVGTESSTRSPPYISTTDGHIRPSTSPSEDHGVTNQMHEDGTTETS